MSIFFLATGNPKQDSSKVFATLTPCCSPVAGSLRQCLCSLGYLHNETGQQHLSVAEYGFIHVSFQSIYTPTSSGLSSSRLCQSTSTRRSIPPTLAHSQQTFWSFRLSSLVSRFAFSFQQREASKVRPNGRRKLTLADSISCRTTARVSPLSEIS